MSTRVLIVDDAAFMRLMIGKILTELGAPTDTPICGGRSKGFRLKALAVIAVKCFTIG